MFYSLTLLILVTTLCGYSRLVPINPAYHPSWTRSLSAIPPPWMKTHFINSKMGWLLYSGNPEKFFLSGHDTAIHLCQGVTGSPMQLPRKMFSGDVLDFFFFLGKASPLGDSLLPFCNILANFGLNENIRESVLDTNLLELWKIKKIYFRGLYFQL